MGDRKLLHKLHTDPEQGMTLLTKQYAGLVYAVVRSKLLPGKFSQGEIEACVADTFSEFYCDLDKYTPDKGSIKAWLCTIAKHNALDYLRKHAQEASLQSLEELPAELSTDYSLELDFDRQDQRELLLRAIQALGKMDREILTRKFYLEQSSKEIAQSLRLSVSNVDTRTHRAIAKLRKEIGGTQG